MGRNIDGTSIRIIHLTYVVYTLIELLIHLLELTASPSTEITSCFFFLTDGTICGER